MIKSPYEISFIKERNIWILVDTDDDDRIIDCAMFEDTLKIVLDNLNRDYKKIRGVKTL